MGKEFTPYEESLEIKELGYSQEFDNDGIWYYATLSSGETRPFCWTSGEDEPPKMYKPIIAPLYQQAFRFFREKYNITSEISISANHRNDAKKWMHSVTNLEVMLYTNSDTTFETYEEAELACLRKMIQIVKSNNS